MPAATRPLGIPTMTVSPSVISARVHKNRLSVSTSCVFYCLFVTPVKLEIASLYSDAVPIQPSKRHE